MSKTAMKQAIEDLMKSPLDLCSQKSIAEWLEACYLEKEMEQLKDCWDAAVDYEYTSNYGRLPTKKPNRSQYLKTFTQ
jgi:hypothetical protein